MSKNFWKNQCVFLTGSTGFLGRHLLEDLTSAGAQVTVLINKTQPKEWQKLKISCVKASILDFDSLSKIVRKIRPSYIIHAAANVNLNRSFDVAKECISLNTQGTLNLLESVKDLKLKRFVYLSTNEVYGLQKAPFKETLRELPPSPYSVSKLAAEHFSWVYAKLYSLPVVCLRVSTCYGPYQQPKRLVPSIISAALKNESLTLHCGAQKRDFTFAADVSNGILKAAQVSAAIGQTINLGQEKTVSPQQIVEIVRQITKSDFKVEYKENFKTRSNEILNWSCNCKKARQILSWKSSTSLKQGLAQTIEWYKQNGFS